MPQPRQRGFTILELIITIALAAILTTIAIPSFRSALQNNRITAQTNDLLTAFQLARSEAVKRGRPVTLCASDVDAGGANPVCGDDWSVGWMVFVDAVGSTGSNAVTVVQRIRVWRPSSVEAQDNAPADLDFVRFLPRGDIDAGAGATFPAIMTLTIPDCTGDQARDIEIVRTGKASAERVACT